MTGSKGSPLFKRSDNVRIGNMPTTINGRNYTSHALDRMQSEGIYSSMVDHVIRTGTRTPMLEGASFRHYDILNDMTVVTSKTGNVITAGWGKW